MNATMTKEMAQKMKQEAPMFRNWGVTFKGIVVREPRETFIVNECKEAERYGLAQAWALREFLLTYSSEC